MKKVQIAELMGRLNKPEQRERLAIKEVMRQNGGVAMSRRAGGYDFVNSRFVVMHGERRVYAIVTEGMLRKNRMYTMYYGEEHPLCDINIVPEDQFVEIGVESER